MIKNFTNYITYDITNYLTNIKKTILQDRLTLIFVLLAIIALIYFLNSKHSVEDFTNFKTYSSYVNNDIFDDKYIDLYENIIIDRNKNNYFIDNIKDIVNLNTDSFVLNIGCKTGNINNILIENNIKSIGIDSSQYMIDFCKKKYDDNNIDFFLFNIDTLDSIRFNTDKNITHILCLNMEIYYISNINLFFSKCYNLLNNDGYLIVHLVDYEKYNNISIYSKLNNFNPNYFLNKLSNKKINNSTIKFNDIIYNTKFRCISSNNNVNNNNSYWLTETIKNKKTNKIHENIHNFNNLTRDDIQQIAKTNNFTLIKIINIDLKNYNNEFIYIFKRNN